MRQISAAAVLLAAALANEADAGKVEDVFVVGTREPGPVFRTIAELCDEIPTDAACEFLNLGDDGDDAERSMGAAPGPYAEPPSCGKAPTDPTCSCPAEGVEKVYDRSKGRLLCMDQNEALTHKTDACMRRAAPDGLGAIVPHTLEFTSFANSRKWGEARRQGNAYYTKLDLDNIQESLQEGKLGYPGEAALHRSRPLSEGIHFVLGHEYVHHKWPDSEHGRLFNMRAKNIRDATLGCR